MVEGRGEGHRLADLVAQMCTGTCACKTTHSCTQQFYRHIDLCKQNRRPHTHVCRVSLNVLSSAANYVTHCEKHKHKHTHTHTFKFTQAHTNTHTRTHAQTHTLGQWFSTGLALGRFPIVPSCYANTNRKPYPCICTDRKSGV